MTASRQPARTMKSTTADLEIARRWRRRASEDRRNPFSATRGMQSERPLVEPPPVRLGMTGGFGDAFQSLGLVALACAIALGVFAVGGRSDLANPAGGFAIAATALLAAGIWRPRQKISQVAGAGNPPTKRTSLTTPRSNGGESPWESLDERLRRLVGRLEEASPTE